MLLILRYASLAVIMTLSLTSGCNEAVCASIVSKCTLLKSCDCDVNETDCSCCKKCYACLGYLYDECCSCVGLCKDTSLPLNNVSVNAQVSQVAKLNSPDSSLFHALTSYGDDVQGRWSSFTFPVDIDVIELHKYPHLERQSVSVQDTFANRRFETFNCTVSYLTQCRSMNKCKKSCESMGAFSFRWFHDSCCECVGSSCLDYGLDESRCLDCPDHEDENEIELTPEEIRFLESEFAEEQLLLEEEEEALLLEQEENHEEEEEEEEISLKKKKKKQQSL